MPSGLLSRLDQCSVYLWPWLPRPDVDASHAADAHPRQRVSVTRYPRCLCILVSFLLFSFFVCIPTVPTFLEALGIAAALTKHVRGTYFVLSRHPRSVFLCFIIVCAGGSRRDEKDAVVVGNSRASPVVSHFVLFCLLQFFFFLG